LMIDLVFYYLFIGLVINVVIAALAVKQGYAIDPKATVASIVVWPVTVVAMITSALFSQEK
jgi:hypothetical protein